LCAGRIRGLIADEVNEDEKVAFAQGRSHRVPAPVVRKAKLFNLAPWWVSIGLKMCARCERLPCATILDHVA
jgi:hypothetical protein